MLAHIQSRDIWSNETFIPYGADSGPLGAEGLSSSSEDQVDREWSNSTASLTLKLEQIRSLRDNWDGEGAMAPGEGIVESTIALLSSLQNKNKYGLPPPTRIVASQAASIVIEWQLEHGEHLEAEILEPYRAEWMLVQPNHHPLHWEGSWKHPAQKNQPTKEYFSESYLAAA